MNFKFFREKNKKLLRDEFSSSLKEAVRRMSPQRRKKVEHKLENRNSKMAEQLFLQRGQKYLPVNKTLDHRRQRVK